MATAAPNEFDPTRPARVEPVLWQRLVEAADAVAYCRAWLALQVAQLDRVGAALLLLRDDAGTYVPAAVWPDPQIDVGYLGRVAQRCLAERAAVSERTSVDGQVRLHAAYPLEVGGEWLGAVVLDLAPRNDADLQQVWRALHWGSGRIETMLLAREFAGRQAVESRSRLALELAAEVEDEPDFERALMQLANSLAARLGCERVAIGIERRGRIRLRALSNAAWFERKADFSAALENAMEEACDQARTVVYPAVPVGPGAEGPAPVAVAHRDVAPREGGACTAVIAVRGRSIGAITSLTETPCTPEFVATLEAAAALIAPNVGLRRDLQRWFAGRIADGVRWFWQGLLDVRRPSFRVGSTVVGLLILWLALADGDYRVTGDAIVEGEVQRAIVAPFEGFLAQAEVKAGQRIAAGDPLAALDDRDLQLEQQKWLAQAEQAERKYRDALARRDRPNARILAAELAEARAQLRLVEDKLARAQITAPFDGVVVTGDLSQMLGTPVEKGKVLFEVAPLDAYRVILKVPERSIRDVKPGQAGEIVLAGLAGESIAFTVRNIGVATAEDGENLFRVEAELAGSEFALRPGMQGVGKIEIGERGLLWIWTHPFFDWLGLKLWQWLP
jgi:multidrug efflux pump subunit AcrA (membrane-fusion protein)